MKCTECGTVDETPMWHPVFPRNIGPVTDAGADPADQTFDQFWKCPNCGLAHTRNGQRYKSK